MKRQEWVLLFSYACICLLATYKHEIWLDEAHHWLLARDSSSIRELLHTMRFEGHPAGWNMLLYLLSRFTHSPMAMQLMNVGISISAVYIFLRYSPFTQKQKTFFVLSYFVIYEYAVISRNYALLMLLVFCLAVSIIKPNRNFTVIGLLLFFLSNVHLFGGIISIGFVIYLLTVYVFANGGIRVNPDLLIGLLLFVAGILLCLIQVWPPSDSPFRALSDNMFTVERMETVSSAFLKGFLPVPDFFQPHYWNTNLLVVHAKPVAMIMAVFFMFLPLVVFLRKPLILLFYYITSGGILFFIFLTGLGSVRYFGLLFILFIVALWISCYEEDRYWYKNNKIINRIGKFNSRFGHYLLTAVLIVQLLAGIVAVILDVKRTFSSGKEAASYIRTIVKPKYTMLTLQVPYPSLCAYLEKKMYVVNRGSLESYVHWEYDFKQTIDERKLLNNAIEYVRSSHEQGLLISEKPIQLNASTEAHVQLLKVFAPSIIRTEGFYIYEIIP